MRKRLRVGLGIGGVVALIAVGLVLFVLFFDWNLLRPTIDKRASAALGRPFAINGDLHVAWNPAPGATGIAAWLPSPHLIARDVTLGNPAGIKGPPLAHLARADIWLAPLGLLHHTIDIPRIALDHLSAHLIRKADGRNNWTFNFGGNEDKKQPSSPWRVLLGNIHFARGSVNVDDAVTHSKFHITISPLAKDVPFDQITGAKKTDQNAGNGDKLAREAGTPGPFVFAWTLDGHYKGAPLSGQGKIGGMLSMNDAAHPFPVLADVRSGDTRVRVAGTIIQPMHFGGAELDVHFSGPSLGQLSRLTGITLPATPAYETDGHVSVRFRKHQGARFAYRDFHGKIGKSDIAGTLVYVLAHPRPKLTGSVTSKKLLFADLAPLVGADASKNKKTKTTSFKQPAGKVLPAAPFNTQSWRVMDANVKFHADEVVSSSGVPISDIYTHLVLDDGDILLDPLRFGVAKGHINTTLRLDGRHSPLRARIDAHVRGLALDSIMPKVKQLDASLGHINGDATLHGTGDSIAAILGDADGRITLLIDNGVISRNLMELAGLNFGSYIVDKLFGDKTTPINCAALDLPIDNGIAKPNVFIFDTKDAVINVTGKTNLATEKLDFTITPRSKGIRIITLRTPLTLHGTYADPSPGVKAGPLVARAAAAVILGVVGTPAASLLALIQPSTAAKNQCGPVIQKIKAASKQSDTPSHD